MNHRIKTAGRKLRKDKTQLKVSSHGIKTSVGKKKFTKRKRG